MGVTIINENDPTIGSTYIGKYGTEIGFTKSLKIGDKNIENDSIQNIIYPKNLCAINQSCINLPPVIVNDLQNQAYFFNDLKKTDSLVKFLEAEDVYESQEEIEHRAIIIKKLDKLFKQWLKDEQEKRIPKNELKGKEHDKREAKSSQLVLAYGSCQLGVQDKNSDLDVMCIAPEFVTREDWIDNFYKVLVNEKEMEDVRTLPLAFIPIIHLKCNKVEVELTFVQLKINHIPKSLDLREDSLLQGLDRQSQRTLNAWRTTDKLLQMVPNVKQFRFTLRAIRLWAKRKGLYGSKLGYLGGISWAILVAKTCLLYPRLDAAGLIQKFFFVYNHWQWPNHVYLVDPEKSKGRTYSVLYNPYEQTNVMPIMTPAFPEENSAYNVTVSSRAAMSVAFKTACNEVDRILGGRNKKCNLGWQNFFKVQDFFQGFEHFIVVFARSYQGAEHLKWREHIEFKLVNYLKILQRHPPFFLPIISTTTYRPKKLPLGSDCSIWFIRLDKSPLLYEDDDNALCEDVLREIDIFKGLSRSQAAMRKLGPVELELRYMNHQTCKSTIKHDLVIRSNKF